jgi:hypothetical protein
MYKILWHNKTNPEVQPLKNQWVTDLGPAKNAKNADWVLKTGYDDVGAKS